MRGGGAQQGAFDGVKNTGVRNNQKTSRQHVPENTANCGWAHGISDSRPKSAVTKAGHDAHDETTTERNEGGGGDGPQAAGGRPSNAASQRGPTRFPPAPGANSTDSRGIIEASPNQNDGKPDLRQTLLSILSAIHRGNLPTNKQSGHRENDRQREAGPGSRIEPIESGRPA